MLDMNHISPLNPVLTIVAVGIVVAAVVFKKRQRLSGGVHPPPGPAPLPLVGNLLSIDSKKPWTTYSAWAARYGNVFAIRAMKQNIIVVNSEKAARDLFERRSGIYSDRPYLVSLAAFGWTFNFAWAPYGDQWRAQKRIFHQAFRAEACLDYQPVQLRKVHQLVLDLLDSPHDYYTHIHRFAASLVMSIVYDYEVAPDHDPVIEILEHGSQLAMEGLLPETSCIIDAFPFVLNLPTWFPGASISRKAAISKACAMKMVSEPFKHVAKRQAEGTNVSAMAFDILNRFKDVDDPVQLQLLKETCTTAYVAGTETTTSTLRWFLFAMLQYPKVQEHAQAELDAVVGADRFPNFQDRPNLPYIEAILAEVMRMYVIVPLGLPHTNMEDDVYGDLFIPKGSTLVPNTWAMLHDEEVYEEPNVFNPERFLKSGKVTSECKAVNNIAFGFGRRVCPGRHIADSSIWIGSVAILSAFKISKALDEQGEEIYFEPDSTTGVVIQPNPFPCTITPRMSSGDIQKLSTADI